MSRRNSTTTTGAYRDFIYSSRLTFASILSIMQRQEETLSMLIREENDTRMRISPDYVDLGTLSFTVGNAPFDIPNTTTETPGLSAETIRTATRRRLFSDITNPLNNRCPIARDDFNPTDEVIQINGCGHLFTPSSLEAWLSRHQDCPLCRYQISTNNPSGRENTALISQITNILNGINLDASNNNNNRPAR
jgi:hypothetical protein